MHDAADLLIRLLADGLVVPIVLLGAWMMVRVPRQARYRLYTRAFMTGITALVLAKTSSLFYHGERPFVATGQAAKAAFLQNGGFPSDHALLVFTITFVVWASTKNVKVSIALLIMSILVGVGRVLALVHTPLDVLGGFVFALIAALLWYRQSFFTLHRKKNY